MELHKTMLRIFTLTLAFCVVADVSPPGNKNHGHIRADGAYVVADGAYAIEDRGYVDNGNEIVFSRTVYAIGTSTTDHAPRIRHSRHLDNFNQPTPSRLAVMDNHKPIIKDCSGYKPVIKEEGKMGAFVTQIKAIDPDPPHSGGTLEFRFVTTPGEKERFSIAPSEGSVFTADIFDHDEPSREKEVYITVRVSDNGIPQLDDTCTIRITIEDINDNAPVFDKVSYTESVPADLELGREVMRISATDIDDGNNSIVRYALDSNSPDHTYFRIDSDTGVIFLNKTIDKPPGYKFRLSGIVKDRGTPPLQSSIALDIIVVESNRKRPMFVEYPKEPLRLNESFQDYSVSIATIKAASNIPGEEDKVQFELVQGQTEQTNKWHTFVLVQDNNIAAIKLASHLDYEKITDYTLTIRIQNSYRLAAEKIVEIEIIDQNDMIPVFNEIRSGTVLENEPLGTFVMQVTAIDGDASPNFRNVTYSIDDPDENFAIDPITGNITTLRTFDRESKAFYHLKVIADDGAESANVPGTTNSGSQVFLIEIADKNDNPPKFGQHTYVAESIAENANMNELVTQVNAVDVDAASVITYSIVDGNTYNAFTIRNLTGEIRVNSNLDYENITNYSLDVRAFDGIYEDYTKVLIQIENLNDNPPVFLQNYTKVIEEERLYDGCIIKVEAYDPDIPDRNAPQNIVYSLVKLEQRSFLDVDNDGCLRLTKPLDRDQPTGFARWQVLIMAADAGGKLGSDSLRTTTEVILELTDINDNAPFLTNPQPVLWMENDPPGRIITLTAKDYDSEINGPPFDYYIPENDANNTHEKFEIRGSDIYTIVTFDREQQKEYYVPIAITDSGTPRKTGISKLHIIIGDRNDNPMRPGHSDIFIYNYKGQAPDTEIGRVFVNDADDWDVNDKRFYWIPSYEDRSPYFDVHSRSGMITMKAGTPPGVYMLRFNVTEENNPRIPFHFVLASVNVTVKNIPDIAVERSGSIRFVNVTGEEFIMPGPDGLSKKVKLQLKLMEIFNITADNIDIFTIIPRVTMTGTYLDIRYAVHMSPYWPAEKLDTMVAMRQLEVEEAVGIKIFMTPINDCMFEKEFCEDSCRNVLIRSFVPIVVYTNFTSFVGINARIEVECTCQIEEPTIDCKNGGSADGDLCHCLPGFNGPRCESTSIGFSGNGFALYEAPQACQDATFSFTMTSYTPDALVFYMGPLTSTQVINVQGGLYGKPGVKDFMSLEVQKGYLVLLLDYGTGTTRINNTVVHVADGKPHLVQIVLMKSSIEMFVDRCKLTTCMSLAAPTGPNEMLNVTTPTTKDPVKIKLAINGPLQLGGVNVDLELLGKEFRWQHIPTTKPFFGCISNMTYNNYVYDLGNPSYQENTDPSCSKSMYTAVSFGIDNNFLVAILVCCAILIILLLAVVVHRRRAEGWAEKELDDIRENIIAYEDEGGGEGDAGYDLHVLRQMYDSHPPDNEGYMHATGRLKTEERNRENQNGDIELENLSGEASAQEINNVSGAVSVGDPEAGLSGQRDCGDERKIDHIAIAIWHQDEHQEPPSPAPEVHMAVPRRFTISRIPSFMPYESPQPILQPLVHRGPERVSVCNTAHCHPELLVHPMPMGSNMPMVQPLPQMMALQPQVLRMHRTMPSLYRSRMRRHVPQPNQNMLLYDGLNKRVSKSGLPECVEPSNAEPMELTILRRPNRERMFADPSQMTTASAGLVGATPDISGFLDDKKTVMDRDPETPFDDVRHYAYEGDGNTSGSLSSLASCTDDGDLKFNYLSTFGPRFRKLADMYGDAEEERPPHHEESWC